MVDASASGSKRLCAAYWPPRPGTEGNLIKEKNICSCNFPGMLIYNFEIYL